MPRQGAAADRRTDHGETPWYEAAQAGHLELAELPLKEGAALDEKGGWPGFAPLPYAAEEGDSGGDLERAEKY